MTFKRYLPFFLLGWMVVGLAIQPASATDEQETRFLRVDTQYIAALGDPEANSGSGAQNWGLWTIDPGPRGVWLRNYEALEAAGGVAPANWNFDREDWWLEENGLIMEAPQFPLAPGKYVVTGNRKVMTVLTVHEPDANGDSRWELDHGASLHDVTHLRCRSARYTPASGEGSCSPKNAPQDAFRVAPGADMPPVAGCVKQDYHVLFLIGVAEDNKTAAID
ncbi:MAG: hypothetical protein QNJ85_03170 [Gammaproteobacteria bacterium]|nr:hypothetical protein [Gammaproteobacteria bacterium]